ncbi:MAG: putative transcriptional regulator [Marmoricola sp.]|nr:putative transcriptional regulator [Marmoricola sp.]
MSRLTDLIDTFRDANGGRSDASIARQAGMAPQTISSWRTRGLKELPKQDMLRGLASVLGLPDEEVFYAAGVDTGYIIETVTEIPDNVTDLPAPPTRRAARKGKPNL